MNIIYSHLLATAESAQRKTEQKKEKEKNRVNNYGWNIFSEEAIYRGYEKRLKNLPTNPDIVQESEEMYSDMLDFGMKSRLSNEVINRVVEDQKKQDEKHADFSKRRKLYIFLLNLLSIAIIKKKWIISMNVTVCTTVNWIVTTTALQVIFVQIWREVLLCNLLCFFKKNT